MNQRISVLALLAGSRHDYLHLARPLLRSMEATQHFDVRVVTDPRELAPGSAQVIVAASDHPLHPGQAAQLTEFVRRGGVNRPQAPARRLPRLRLIAVQMASTRRRS